jgi:hypothetical protein
MAETPVLERLTPSDLFLLQRDDSSWCSDIDGLAILDGTRLSLVSATSDSDGAQRLLRQSLGAVSSGGSR